MSLYFLLKNINYIMILLIPLGGISTFKEGYTL